MMQLYQQYFASFKDRPVVNIKSDYMNMHLDLKKLYPEAQKINYGYAFADMFSSLAGSTDILSVMNTVDLCVLINRTHEFDAYFSHIGSHLLDYYSFTFDIVDFSESTQLPLYKAFSLIRTYFASGAVSRACVLSFEQRGSLTYMSDINLSLYQNALSALFFLSP